MMKKIILLVCMLFLPLSAHAEWIIDIFNQLIKTNDLLYNVKSINLEQSNRLSDIKNINQSELNQMTKTTASLTGTHQFGAQYYDVNRFNGGAGSTNWQSILALVNNGGGSGELGTIVKQVNTQFPLRTTLGSSNELTNEYYRMQAQTTIASRASSELAFNQLHNEEASMHKLHQLIDTTPDDKSAVDLNNRLMAENAMINLQQAKLLAALVQQVSIDSQEKANRAKENAEFFDIK